MVGFIQHVLRSVLSVLSRLRGEALKLANAAPTHRGESERERSCILATMYASDLLGELVGAARFVHCPAETGSWESRAISTAGHGRRSQRTAPALVRMRLPLLLSFLCLASGHTDRPACLPAGRLMHDILRIRGGGGLAFDAALFDFDGTLTQSEGLHRLAFSEVLGTIIEEEEWELKCVGTSPAKLVADRLPPGASQQTIDALLVQRSVIFEKWVAEGKLDATAGAEELLQDLSENGVRCAVVSSGSRSYIEKALRHLGLAKYFEFIVAGDDDVMQGEEHKPHPFPYLHAAKRLGVRPERCVAFEDSLSGIRSAQAASMLVIAVKNAANAALPEVPDEAPCAKTGIEPLMALVEDFDVLDRSFMY